MKKMKVNSMLLALLLCTALTVGALTTQTVWAAKEGAKRQSETLIDFENVKDILKSIRITNFNKGELCAETKYVTQGKYCLHLHTLEDEGAEMVENSDTTLVLYPAKSSYIDVEYVSLDVYNATEDTRRAVFGFGEIYEEVQIEPGANTIWLYVDRARLEYESKGEIEDFYLIFSKGDSETAMLDLYLDNFKCYTATTSYEKYEADFSKDVKYAFEQEAELANLSTNIRLYLEKPMFHINRDIRYIKSGTGSLQVDIRETGLTSFRIKDGQLGDFNKYSEQMENYYLSFPIYNANEFDITCSIVITSVYNNETVTINSTIPAGTWSGDSQDIALSALAEQFTGDTFGLKSIEFNFGGFGEAGTVYIDSISVCTKEG